MNRDFYEKGVDLKLLLLLYGKKIWMSALGVIIGMVVFGGAYFVSHVVWAPARQYEGISKLYLTFDEKDDGDAYQYYNGYTWNDLIGTEPIMDEIVKELKKAGGLVVSEGDVAGPAGEGASADEALRAYVRASVTADILSDIRLLTVTVRTERPENTDVILRACENALIAFGAKMQEFEKIEVFEHGKAALVILEDDTKRMVAAGAFIGFIVSLMAIAIKLVMEDKIYVPGDVTLHTGLAVMGVTFERDEVKGRERLSKNLAAAGCETALRLTAGISVDWSADAAGGGADSHNDTIAGSEAVPGANEAAAGGGAAGIILEIPFGKASVRVLKSNISDLRLRGSEIKGAIITEAKPQFFDRYYKG